MLHWMVTLILFLLLTACQPALLPSDLVTATPVDISTAAETPTKSATATATPLPTDTPTPEVTNDPYQYTATALASTSVALSKIEPEVTHLNGLVIYDTALMPAEPYRLRPEDQDNNPQFYQLLPHAMQGWPEDLLIPPAPSEAEAQAVLAQFGYRLEQIDDCCYWRLLQGETLLSDKVTRGSEQFQVNRSGTDFWMLLSVDGDQSWLLRKGSFELWYQGEPHPNPVFVGDDFFTAQVGMDTQGDKKEAHVKRNGENVFSYSGPEFWVCPLENFRAWEDQWVLEIDDEVFVDGQSLREAGYARSFSWQTLGGKPYFLFQKSADSPYGISYAGQDLPLQYDEIVYWTCMEKQPVAPFNPHGSEQMATFFAREEGMWHFVKVMPEEGIRE